MLVCTFRSILLIVNLFVVYAKEVYTHFQAHPVLCGAVVRLGIGSVSVQYLRVIHLK